MRVDAGMPVEAAVEDRVQVRRAPQMLRPLQHLVELLGKLLADMAERDAGQAIGEGTVQHHAALGSRPSG